MLLALQEQHLAEPLLPLRARVDEVRVGAHLTRDDAKDVDAAGERVGDGLEDERGGAVGLDAEVERLLRGRGHAFHQ